DDVLRDVPRRQGLRSRSVHARGCRPRPDREQVARQPVDEARGRRVMTARTAYSGAPARLQPPSRGPCDNEWAMADNDARGGTMRSTLTRVATLAGFAATALTAAAIAQAATPQVHDDAAVIARHRAAGQLGQPNVYVNEALIA